LEIPTIPIRQRSTELTPNSGGLGYGKPEKSGINLTAWANGTIGIILSLPVKFHQAQNFKT
jgi:hypothetical protein